MSRNIFAVRKRILDVWCEHIADAEESVLVAAYKLTSEKAFNALFSAFKRGVKVRVILDQLAAESDISLAKKAIIEGLEIHFWPSRELGKLHTKLYIIDNRELIFGSFNLTKTAEKYNTETFFRSDDSKLLQEAVQAWKKILDKC